SNSFGQLGNGGTSGGATPVDVVGLNGSVLAVGTASQATCAVLSGGGGVMCWGSNSSGQLGTGVADNLAHGVPQPVGGNLDGVLSIHGGQSSNCAVLNNGGLKCWGGGDISTLFGSSGNFMNRFAPVSVLGLAAAEFAVAS